MLYIRQCVFHNDVEIDFVRIGSLLLLRRNPQRCQKFAALSVLRTLIPPLINELHDVIQYLSIASSSWEPYFFPGYVATKRSM